MATMTKALGGAGFVLVSVLGGVVTGDSAGAHTTPTSVGPRQAYLAMVNGASANATVQVVCPGPLTPNQTGKPVSGQTIGIASPSTTAASEGFTGRRATSIVAEFVPPATVGATIEDTFTIYGNLPIPTTAKLPCSGTATVVFTPTPSSRAARNARVSITFEATCGQPACPVNQRRDRR
jgi:hypothetical protein